MNKRLIKLNFLDNIDSPQKLLKYMKDNISYGYIDKNNNIHNDEDEDEQIFYDNYILQSPYELYKNKIGVCWDQSEFERYFFDRFNVKYNVYYIELDNQYASSHSFLIYSINNEYYWFEHSYFKYKGIHGPFKTEIEIIKLIYKYMSKHNENKGFKCYKLDKPLYDISAKEYMKFAKLNIILKS